MAVVRRLTPSRMEDLGAVLRGSWGRGCWCMHPRKLGNDTTAERKRAMTGLARRKRAPGLLAYLDKEPVGWVAIAPRLEGVVGHDIQSLNVPWLLVAAGMVLAVGASTAAAPPPSPAGA